MACSKTNRKALFSEKDRLHCAPKIVNMQEKSTLTHLSQKKNRKAGVSAPIDASSYGLTKQNEICWMFKTM